MKKIIGALLVGAMIGGVAFAEASIGLNARVYTDAFIYDGVSELSKKGDTNDRGTDDNGTVTWFKDTKHADDVAISAATEGAGAKLTLNIESGAVGMTAYQLWLTRGDFRIDAGTFDTRPINLASYDGNWNNNYCGFYKPGIYDVVKGRYAGRSLHGKDAGNLTILKGAKKNGNVMMPSYKFGDLGLTVRGAVFLMGTTTPANGSAAPFVPFGVQAEYKIGKAATVAATVKMVDSKELQYYYSGYGDASITTAEDNEYFTESKGVYTGVKKSTKLDPKTEYYTKEDTALSMTEWTFNVEGLITAIDKTKIMVGYTLDASFFGRDGKGESKAGDTDYADYNEFIHGIDLRVENTSVKNLGVYLNANFTFMPATKVLKDNVDEWGKLAPAVKDVYDNEDAYKDASGLNGKMAMWTTFGANYKLNDTFTVGLQGKYACTDFTATRTNKDGKIVNDAAAKMALNLRPGVDITFAKGCIFSAGVDIGLSNFSKSVKDGTTDEYDALQTTVSIPMMMRVKL